MARFERSTLPEHQGTRTVVLRFLKIITSVKCTILHYDGSIVEPKEGELHRKFTRKIKKKGLLNSPVWSVNIDETSDYMKRGLQLLWDV